MNEIEVDVHGLTKDMAKREIEQTIAKCPQNIKRIIIIHGYQNGDAIKTMVHSPNGIRSKRIKRKRFTMNQGITILELF